jgi:hypothetical protein
MHIDQQLFGATCQYLHIDQQLFPTQNYLHRSSSN